MDYRNDPTNQIPQNDQPENNPGGNSQNGNNQNGNNQNGNNQGGYNQNWQPSGYPYQPYRPYQPYQTEPKNTFAVVAMVLGLCSILSLCTFFLPLPLGALSIVFVILSRRQGRKMSSPAVTGLVTSLVGIGVGLVFLVSVMITTLSLFKPENRDELNQQFENIYGMDFNEYMEQIYGDDFADIMNQIEDQLR
ncbi:MAG TPA: DUF4190 domain-containing protein [Lachnospiraceae bacterium]|nr:DUF4190 domain-containing protein [Lachnospiraceae bacterium]